MDIELDARLFEGEGTRFWMGNTVESGTNVTLRVGLGLPRDIELTERILRKVPEPSTRAPMPSLDKLDPMYKNL